MLSLESTIISGFILREDYILIHQYVKLIYILHHLHINYTIAMPDYGTWWPNAGLH